MVYYIELKGYIYNAIKKSGINIIRLKRATKNNLIPLSVLEKACKLNLKNKFCDINLQYVWFCLDKECVHRKFSKGWKKIKVSFSDTYVENSEKNKKIISEAYDSCPKPKSKIFSGICRKHYVSIRGYISGKNKIPLSVFLKSCQLLGIDAWRELNNCKLYSGSSERSRFIIFKNEISAELYILLNWIKLEGNLGISRPIISISQNIYEKLCFEKLKKYFQQVFNVPENSMNLLKSKTRPNILILTINSAPLRQLLNLKYEIPLGYKSREIEPNISFRFNKEDILKILASEMETEGSFARHRKYNITHCDICFSTYSKNYSKSVFNELRELGYPANFSIFRRSRRSMEEIEYKVSFWGVFKIQKFAFEIMPYFHHLNKIKNLMEVIKQEDFLKITRINMNNNIKELIYKAKDKCGNFKLLTQKLNKERLQISHKGVEAWVYQLNKVSVYAILKMCFIIGEKDYFKYLPKEIAFSLWLNKFIVREVAEDLRGIENAYKHIDFLIKSPRDRLTP
jgi:hypothetical protein